MEKVITLSKLIGVLLLFCPVFENSRNKLACSVMGTIISSTVIVAFWDPGLWNPFTYVEPTIDFEDLLPKMD